MVYSWKSIIVLCAVPHLFLLGATNLKAQEMLYQVHDSLFVNIEERITFTPQDNYFIVKRDNRTLYIANTLNGRVVNIISAAAQNVFHSRDEQYLGVSSWWGDFGGPYKGAAQVWDWKRGLKTIEKSIEAGVAFFPGEGDTVFITNRWDEGTYESATGRLLDIPTPSGPIRYILRSPNGRYLIYSLDGIENWIWDMHQAKVFTPDDQCKEYARTYGFTGDSRFMLSVPYQTGQIQICDTETYSWIRQIDAPVDIHDLRLLPDDGTVAVVGVNGVLYELDWETGEVRLEYALDNAAIKQYIVAPNGDTYLLLGTDGIIRSIETTSGRMTEVRYDQRKPVHSMSLSHDGSRLLTLTSTGTITAWKTSWPLIVQTPTDIKMMGSGLSVPNLYPNPANNSATLIWHQDRPLRISIKIYTPLGLLTSPPIEGVFDQGRHSKSINTEHLPSGTYYLNIQSGETSRSIVLQVIR